MNRYSHRRIAALMGLEASTLAIIAPLHLSGVLGGDSKPFDPHVAGAAEAIIGAAVLLGALALLRNRRDVAITATAFAIIGFLVGLSFTLRGGTAIDVAYHMTMLPLLLVTLLALFRNRHPRRQAYVEPPARQKQIGILPLPTQASARRPVAAA